MTSIAQNLARLFLVALLFAGSAWAASPAIPAPFTGTWSQGGACETAYSDGVLIDAGEVMFGETGFFVDHVVLPNATEIEVSASQPPESPTQSTLHLHLRLSDRGHVLTIADADGSSTAYRHCDSRP